MATVEERIAAVEAEQANMKEKLDDNKKIASGFERLLVCIEYMQKDIQDIKNDIKDRLSKVEERLCTAENRTAKSALKAWYFVAAIVGTALITYILMMSFGI